MAPSLLVLSAPFVFARGVISREVAAFGYDWSVRDTLGGKSGPGPNVFDGENVFVDGDGALHMKVSNPEKAADGWHCSEVTLPTELGYGDYDFFISQDVSALAEGDASVVLGLFLYKDDSHELDVEFARWGDASSGAMNADYVNQPGGEGKTLLWQQPALRDTMHRISYKPGRVDWSSQQTSIFAPAFQTFTSTRLVPDPAGMLVHINLWMHQGLSSWAGDTLDVAIENFRFTPYNSSATTTPSAAPTAPTYLPEGCEGQDECYVYSSREAAEASCIAAGFSRLCGAEEATGHEFCKAGWFLDAEGYWMGRATAGCGNAGFNAWREGTPAGAYCCGGSSSPLRRPVLV